FEAIRLHANQPLEIALCEVIAQERHVAGRMSAARRPFVGMEIEGSVELRARGEIMFEVKIALSQKQALGWIARILLDQSSQLIELRNRREHDADDLRGSRPARGHDRGSRNDSRSKKSDEDERQAASAACHNGRR